MEGLDGHVGDAERPDHRTQQLDIKCPGGCSWGLTFCFPSRCSDNVVRMHWLLYNYLSVYLQQALLESQVPERTICRGDRCTNTKDPRHLFQGLWSSVHTKAKYLCCGKATSKGSYALSHSPLRGLGRGEGCLQTAGIPIHFYLSSIQ